MWKNPWAGATACRGPDGHTSQSENGNRLPVQTNFISQMPPLNDRSFVHREYLARSPQQDKENYEMKSCL